MGMKSFLLLLLSQSDPKHTGLCPSPPQAQTTIQSDTEAAAFCGFVCVCGGGLGGCARESCCSCVALEKLILLSELHPQQYLVHNCQPTVMCSC